MDWSPLADADPVPGDPQAVHDLAGRYAAAAREVGAQRTALGRIAGSGSAGPDGGAGAGPWSGPAGQAFAEHVGGLPRDLDEVSGRLQRIAQALSDFAPALDAAQRQARAALARAQQARDLAVARASAPAQLASAVPHAEPFIGPVVNARLPGAEWRCWPSHDPALVDDPDIAAAHRMLDRACAERDAAAHRCARALHAAGHDRLSDPSRWHRMLGAVSRWAGRLSMALGVAAFFLGWVPGLGEMLGAAVLAASAVQLLADATLKAEYGDRSWARLAGDALGVLPVGDAARIGSGLTRAEAVERAVAGVTRSPSAPLSSYTSALHGISLAASSPRLFALTRGWHGLTAWRPTLGLAGARTLRAAAETGAIRTLVRSPGGLVHEIGLARAQGASGVAWLVSGYAWDAGHVASSLATSGPAPVGLRSGPGAPTPAQTRASVAWRPR